MNNMRRRKIRQKINRYFREPEGSKGLPFQMNIYLPENEWDRFIQMLLSKEDEMRELARTTLLALKENYEQKIRKNE